ncbi:TetR/AcrR family transcriptional regulator [Natronohydrobacter thiooxidans]|uniref:TetR/AcrR family transcriptional regulator n=1 Tax=Natronohydrobacter thiooxidans TaxID=87172 RepID=UPI0008FF47BF|nr:TetR/AcrR family transcriptional regulator [Natronohydrobacter thiooxidans]
MPVDQARDRDATEASLIAAVEAIILEEGFGAVGINTIARSAGVTKPLIYRYFGGLSGLLAAYAEQGDFWWRVDDVLADPIPAPDSPDALARTLATVFERHAAFLRTHPVTLEVITWEMLERNELTEALETVRETRSAELMTRLAVRFDLPQRELAARLQPMLALLGGAANYLAARGRRIRRFGGIDLQSDEGWHDLNDCAAEMIAGSLSRS